MVIGKRSIVKMGCFDILHMGHVRMFEKCKAHADVLIVLVGTDNVLKKLYGDSPKANSYFDQFNRMRMVAALECVDCVCPLTEPTHEFALSIIEPTYYEIPDDDKWLEEKTRICLALDIKVVVSPNIKIFNHGKEFEPHTSEIKKHLSV